MPITYLDPPIFALNASVLGLGVWPSRSKFPVGQTGLGVVVRVLETIHGGVGKDHVNACLSLQWLVVMLGRWC